jgi:hypothetical protein
MGPIDFSCDRIAVSQALQHDGKLRIIVQTQKHAVAAMTDFLKNKLGMADVLMILTVQYIKASG